MTDNKVIEFKSQAGQASFTDALSELVRQGARQIIAQAVEAELQSFLSGYDDLKDEWVHLNFVIGIITHILYPVSSSYLI